MTNTATTYRHSDGGTFREIAYADTRHGWGINVTEWTTYRGEVVFEVNRVTPAGMFTARTRTQLRLSLHGTEASARAAANRAWITELSH